MPGIIILPVKKHQPTLGGVFTWNDKHQAYLYKGRVLSDAEFNENMEEVMRRFHDTYFSPPIPQIVKLTQAERKELARAITAQKPKPTPTIHS